MRSTPDKDPKAREQPRKTSVVVRRNKLTVVIQDRSGSMSDYIDKLDYELKTRKLGNQYIFFATSVARTADMTPVNVGSGTIIFPAFEEMLSYIKTEMPKKLDIIFISDGEDNGGMDRCRRDFTTHLGKLRAEFPEIEEHRLFTIGVGPSFPCNLVCFIPLHMTCSCRVDSKISVIFSHCLSR